mmetsp:Transcript_58655/g.162310  ORF Transcript_58655/g.162310 Transcript_58655/m.162310 type:complete len:210 (+) Transcript_58655:3-632(+)
MRIGSSENIALGGGADVGFGEAAPLRDVDLSGVWSLRLQGAPGGWADWLFAGLRLEALASFAGSFAEGRVLRVPIGLDRQTGYSSTVPSLGVMWSHALRWGLDATTDLQFANSSFATFDGSDEFARKGDDEWVRTSSLLGWEVKTVFARAIFANGTTHRDRWQQLLADMNGYSLRVFVGENLCRRKCETTARLTLLPGWAACTWCAFPC